MTTITEQLEAMTALLSLSALANILGIHRMTLYSWTKDGKVPAVRIGSRWKYDPAQIAGWYAARQSA